MSTHQHIISEIVTDGVKITTYEDGSQHFKPIQQSTSSSKSDNRNWLKKLIDWFNTAKITPYIKVRDLADPFNDRSIKNPDDADVGSDGKQAPEIGIKIKF